MLYPFAGLGKNPSVSLLYPAGSALWSHLSPMVYRSQALASGQILGHGLAATTRGHTGSSGASAQSFDSYQFVEIHQSGLSRKFPGYGRLVHRQPYGMRNSQVAISPHTFPHTRRLRPLFFKVKSHSSTHVNRRVVGLANKTKPLGSSLPPFTSRS